MKATLFFPPAFLPFKLISGTVPLGIYILGTILNKNGIETKVLDQFSFIHLADPNNPPTEQSFLNLPVFREAVAGVDVVGFSCDSFNFSVCKLMIASAKAIDKEVKVVVGGVHATLLDEATLRESGADLVVRGEAEETICSIFRALHNNSDCSTISGLTYFGDSGEIVRTKDSEFSSGEMLGALNKIDYSLIQSMDRLTGVPIETSRGCLFKCRFCSVPYKGKRRLIPLDNVKEMFAEVSTIRSDILLTDDCLTSELQRTEEFLSFVNEFDVRITFEARASDLCRKGCQILDKIDSKKIDHIQIGVEAGYKEGLVKLQKGITLPQVEKVAEMAATRGIKLLATFIIGFPWETKRECMATIDFAGRMREDYGVDSVVNWWIPTPSKLWYENKEAFGVDESMYNDIMWPVSKEVFKKNHPQIDERSQKQLAYLIRQTTRVT